MGEATTAAASAPNGRRGRVGTPGRAGADRLAPIGALLVAAALACGWLVFPSGAGAVSLARSDLAVGNDPYGVSLADLNLDGWPDLVTGNRTGASVTVKLGSDTAGYTDPVDYAVGEDVVDVSVADVTGDGKPDVVTPNFFSDSVSVLAGTGSGTLEAPIEYPAGSRPNDVVLRDVSGDGRIDIAVSNLSGPVASAGEASVLIANGSGGFAARVGYPAGTGPSAIAAADFDEDGAVDLVVANTGIPGDTVSVLPGLGGGSFGAASVYPAGDGPVNLAAGDFDEDGGIDLAVADDGALGTSNPGTPGVSVLTGDRAGAFALDHTYPSDTSIVDVAAGDLDGDGSQDLASVSGANTYTVLVGKGDGDFAAQPSLATGAGGNSVAIGQMMPSDSKLDLAVANRTDDSVSRYLNIGQPSFTSVPASVDFGAQLVGTESAERAVTIRNDGDYALQLSTLGLVGTDAGDFGLDGALCAGRMLAPEEGCRTDVWFSPTTTGERSAALAVAHDAPGGPGQIALTGTGTIADTGGSDGGGGTVPDTGGNGGGGSIVSPGSGPGPAVDRAAPSVGVRLPKRVSRVALLRGLKVRVSCDEPCRLSAELLLDRRTAKRLGLGRARLVRIGAANRRLTKAGTAMLTLRPTAKARSRLRIGRLGSVTVRVTGVDDAGNRSSPLTRKVGIRA
jgi:hypothetical protein